MGTLNGIIFNWIIPVVSFFSFHRQCIQMLFFMHIKDNYHILLKSSTFTDKVIIQQLVPRNLKNCIFVDIVIEMTIY